MQPSPPQQQQNDWYTPSVQPQYQQNPQQHSFQQQPQMMMMQPQAQGSHPYGMHSTYGLDGSMDVSGRSGGSGGGYQPQQQLPQMQPSTFVPQMAKQQNDLNYGEEYFDNEPPLLEELGVNLEHIFSKTKAVVVPFRRWQKDSVLSDPAMIAEDADLAGPLAFALLLGAELMMSGKLGAFGYIYGFGMFGCLAMTVVLNLMSPDKPIGFWTVTSILGYSLLPVNVLAALKIVLFFSSVLTKLFAVIAVIWSTTASTRLLELGCDLSSQRYLLAYPIALLYSAFVLITIF
jgi:protein YIPF5/7